MPLMGKRSLNISALGIYFLRISILFSHGCLLWVNVAQISLHLEFTFYVFRFYTPRMPLMGKRSLNISALGIYFLRISI